MIETAIELTEGRITGSDIRAIMELGKTMLNAEVQLLDSVADSLEQLAKRYPLMVITKGDLLDQERKIASSGLEGYFQHVEIVSRKTDERYLHLLKRHAIEPGRFLMVGNSLKSDILPVLAVGGSAVYIPYEVTWLHEMAEPPAAGQDRYYSLANMGQLPELLESIEQNGNACTSTMPISFG
jgi:putative hydrolase of the HAD superfamily